MTSGLRPAPSPRVHRIGGAFGLRNATAFSQ
jgi:hypothetical protein